MHPEQYAVVRTSPPTQSHCGPSYKFTKFHETLEEAKAEATRLASLEKSRFIVLKMVGFAEPTAPPAVWSDF